MDIKELRIGNFLYELLDGVTPGIDLFVVASINSLTNTLIDVNDNITQIDYCAPIPITEEWLLKLGFEKRGPVDALYNDHWRHPNLNPVFSEETFTALTMDDGIDIAYDIKYVHQIQNVFFALTGSELTIKELV